MAHDAVAKFEKYEATRVTIQCDKPFNDVMSKLYSSIGSPADLEVWKSPATSNLIESREAFMARINSRVGSHGFMIFQEFDHGSWIPIFDTGEGRKIKRVILGNPLIAITMLKRDLYAGLAVPVEILVLEREKHLGTEVVYNLPSGLVAGINRDEDLVKSVAVLDGKLEALGRFIVS